MLTEAKPATATFSDGPRAPVVHADAVAHVGLREDLVTVTLCAELFAPGASKKIEPHLCVTGHLKMPVSVAKLLVASIGKALAMEERRSSGTVPS